jgi:hypothetical protein
MRKLLPILALTIALVLAACGGSSAPDAPLTVEEALAAGNGPATVSGMIVAPEGEDVRLCSGLLESYPPQCGGPSLVVRGADLESLPGVTSTDDPALAQVTWTDGIVELAGTLEDGVLTVSRDA